MERSQDREGRGVSRPCAYAGGDPAETVGIEFHGVPRPVRRLRRSGSSAGIPVEAGDGSHCKEVLCVGLYKSEVGSREAAADRIG